MSQMVEFELVKVLERIEQRIDRIEQKVDKLTEGQARQEEQIKSLQKGQDDLKFSDRWIIALVVTIIGSIFLRALNIIPNP